MSFANAPSLTELFIQRVVKMETKKYLDICSLKKLSVKFDEILWWFLNSPWVCSAYVSFCLCEYSEYSLYELCGTHCNAKCYLASY